MNGNQNSQINKDFQLIVKCEKCCQKLRIPLRYKKIRVTCPACRHEFDYQYGEEFQHGEVFHSRIPSELKGLVISLIPVIVWGFFGSLERSLHKNIFPDIPDIIPFLLTIMALFGMMSFIVFGIGLLIDRRDIIRFVSIKKIVISRQGIALFHKARGTDILIDWQHIKAVKLRYLKHMLLGSVEIGREPVEIEFNLVDGSSFKIPLDQILKEKERNRLISMVNHYLPFSNYVISK